MSNLMTQDLYLSAFTHRQASLPGKDQAWLKDLRLKALEHFKQAGFPTDKLESWKYTNLANNLLKMSLSFELPQVTPSAVTAQLKKRGFEVEKAHVMVFVNGAYSAELSSLKTLPKGVVIQNLASALAHETVKTYLGQVASAQKKAFTALNMAYFTDGLFLNLAAGQLLEWPVHVVYLSANANQTTQSHLRNLIVLGNDSRAQVIEHYWGENVSAYLTNAVTEVVLSQGSALDHTKIGEEDLKGYHVGSVEAKQNEASQFISRTFSVGGALTRNEIDTTLAQKKAENVMEGLYFSKGRQHVDTRTFIDHLSPNCNSHETFKGVLDGESTAIFDGFILVRENAQKTDARQSNKNLQLSNTAKVYSKPQLQIYADDVKCSHGSATGQMDEEALFYFQSRGISRADAKKALVYAFAGEMVERVSSEYLKPALTKLVQDWMGGAS